MKCNHMELRINKLFFTGVVFEMRVPLYPLEVKPAEKEVGAVVVRLLRERIFGHKVGVRLRVNH